MMSLLCLTTAQALAGIADSPLAVLLAGQPTYHVYAAPGVQNAGFLRTFFSRTNPATATLIVDLNAAEVASPGGFINQPLMTILMAGHGGPAGGAGQPVDVSMIVMIEKN